MARRIRPVVLFAFAALLAAPPAFAQFGSIFGNPPPRPPADVPSAPPQQSPPYYPSNRDTPPSQPLPAPMNLPPSNRPGAGSVQSQPLPPPPGGIVAPAPPSGQRPQQDVSTPSQPPAALPPGRPRYATVMPPFAGALTDDDLAQVLTFARRTFGKGASAITPAQVHAER